MDRRRLLPVLLVIIYLILVGLIIWSDEVMVALNNDHDTLLAKLTYQPPVYVEFAGAEFIVEGREPNFEVSRIR